MPRIIDYDSPRSDAQRLGVLSFVIGGGYPFAWAFTMQFAAFRGWFYELPTVYQLLLENLLPCCAIVLGVISLVRDMMGSKAGFVDKVFDVLLFRRQRGALMGVSLGAGSILVQLWLRWIFR